MPAMSFGASHLFTVLTARWRLNPLGSSARGAGSGFARLRRLGATQFTDEDLRPSLRLCHPSASPFIALAPLILPPLLSSLPLAGRPKQTAQRVSCVSILTRM